MSDIKNIQSQVESIEDEQELDDLLSTIFKKKRQKMSGMSGGMSQQNEK